MWGADSIVGTWLDIVYLSGFNGILYWQFVGSFLSGYQSLDDGNGINTSESTYSEVKAMAVKLNAKSGGSGGSGSGGSGTMTAKATHMTTAVKTTTPASSGGMVQHWG
jgi:hypothetical protein